jgi:3-oxoacyl-[acyl-carrier protein] reductase
MTQSSCLNSLANKVALVIGGTGGIGSAICEEIAAAGAAVVVGYMNSAERAELLAAQLPKSSLPHAALRAPVTDSIALSELAAEIDRRYGRCDILVNCAGTTRYVPHTHLNELDDVLIDDILATNVRGPFATVRALHSLMRSSGDALVVNISSIAAVTAMGSNIMYCASKAALDNMTKSLARALAPEIRVVSVSPGLVETEFVKKMDKTWRDEQVERTPLKRLASPKEIARAVVAMASNLVFVTGAIIPIDGGRPIG